MNLAHIHLLLNHFPVIGTIIGVVLFVGALIGNSTDLKKASLLIFLGIALLSIPVYMSGNAAEQVIKNLPGISEQLIVQHENAALLAYVLMEITGAVAWFGLWRFRRTSQFGGGTLLTIFLLSLITVGLMANASNLGGQIRHPEILSGSEASAPAASGLSLLSLDAAAIGRFAVGGEGGSRWVWATCQTLHFIGLTLLMGIVCLVDLRVLGLMKNVSFAALHRLLPWGMLGFALNLFTGMLYFLGAPEQYTKNPTFYWKISLMLIGGANAIYFTVFDGPWDLRASDVAPFRLKAIALSGFALWVGVMFCGLMLPFLGNAF
jgi:uncharacterized membrane protein